MKKTIIFISILTVIMFNGCSLNYEISLNSNYINSLYSDEDKIESKSNSYILNDFDQTISDKEYTGQINFEGMDTIWEFESESECEVEISYSLSVTNGAAKLVLIKPDGNLETIVESSEEVAEDDITSTTLSLNKGEYRIKLVGRDMSEINLKLKVLAGELYKIGSDEW